MEFLNASALHVRPPHKIYFGFLKLRILLNIFHFMLYLYAKKENRNNSCIIIKYSIDNIYGDTY